jgi:hypothetical protein
MKKVFICSPFAGDTERNIQIARKLCKLEIEAGNAPFADWADHVVEEAKEW